MGLLNRLFRSTESIAKEIEIDAEAIIKHWQDYLKTLARKEEIIGKLREDDDFRSNLDELTKLLTNGAVRFQSAQDLEGINIGDRVVFMGSTQKPDSTNRAFREAGLVIGENYEVVEPQGIHNGVNNSLTHFAIKTGDGKTHHFGFGYFGK
mgnify:CR=1 FL=1